MKSQAPYNTPAHPPDYADVECVKALFRSKHLLYIDPYLKRLVIKLRRAVQVDYGKALHLLSDNDLTALANAVNGEIHAGIKQNSVAAVTAIGHYLRTAPGALPDASDLSVSASVWRAGKSVPAWVWVLAVAIVVLSAFTVSSRYTFINVRPGIIAVGDRWTGCTEMRNYRGTVVGPEC